MPSRILESPQQITDNVEARVLLIGRADDGPGRGHAVRPLQHLISRLAVGVPELGRFSVDRAELPLAEWVLTTFVEAPLLLGLRDVEIIFEQRDPRSLEHGLEMGNGFEEFLGLGLGAKAHHALDPGTVVPAAIEQHDFTLGRKMGDVALEIPGMLVALARRTERHDSRFPRAQMLNDPLDGSVFARGIAAL